MSLSLHYLWRAGQAQCCSSVGKETEARSLELYLEGLGWMGRQSVIPRPDPTPFIGVTGETLPGSHNLLVAVDPLTSSKF